MDIPVASWGGGGAWGEGLGVVHGGGAGGGAWGRGWGWCMGEGLGVVHGGGAGGGAWGRGWGWSMGEGLGVVHGGGAGGAYRMGRGDLGGGTSTCMAYGVTPMAGMSKGAEIHKEGFSPTPTIQGEASMPVLLKGGRVIDPANQLDREPCDVLLDGKVVIEVGEDLQAPDEGCEVFNASGCLVCPGLVDLHVHCFPGGSVLGVDPDEWCLKRGVTTVVDAGSSGREGSRNSLT